MCFSSQVLQNCFIEAGLKMYSKSKPEFPSFKLQIILQQKITDIRSRKLMSPVSCE